MNRRTDKPKDRNTDRLKQRNTDKQAGRQTDRQKDRGTDRQTETQIYRPKDRRVDTVRKIKRKLEVEKIGAHLTDRRMCVPVGTYTVKKLFITVFGKCFKKQYKPASKYVMVSGSQGNMHCY
jgi:hypothetical protein